jgi:NDP-sugar pyrophosphorylase family protein
MKAVILAGGLGTRLAPLTKVIPKPLLPVGEKSVLEIQLTHMKKNGFKEIFLCLGYKSELFEAYFGNGDKFGLKIHYQHEKSPLGTAGPIRLISASLDEPFLVINGDILTDMNFKKLADFHIKNKAAMTIASKKVIIPLHYGTIKHKGNRVIDIIEKPALSSDINAGIYFMNPEVLDLIPYNEKYSMDVLIKRLIALKKYKVCRYELKNYWLDIGQMEDYNKAQEIFK